MIKAIILKEWIKTRICTILSLVTSIVMCIYALLRIERVINIKGMSHLWEILIAKDVVFIDLLKYVPGIIGIVLAIVQFVPEMQMKRLKLTLHLPFSSKKMILTMLGYGVCIMLVITLIIFTILYLYLHNILADELTFRILYTAIPWFIAGISAYLWSAFIVLEPTWRRRLLNTILAFCSIYVLFMSNDSEAYNKSLVVFIPLTFLSTLLPLLSIKRFKNGCQD